MRALPIFKTFSSPRNIWKLRISCNTIITIKPNDPMPTFLRRMITKKRERELFHRIDGKTTATSHCFETVAPMVIYPSSEQPIIFRDMPTPWGSAPWSNCTPSSRSSASISLFPTREKKRVEALDPFNAFRRANRSWADLRVERNRCCSALLRRKGRRKRRLENLSINLSRAPRLSFLLSIIDSTPPRPC